MNRILKSVAAVALGLSTTAVMATPPAYLTITNNTELHANSLIGGKQSATKGTAPGSTSQLFWTFIKLTCAQHKQPSNACSATIMLGLNTSNPVELGSLTLNVDTGVISPSVLQKGNYVLTVDAPGKVSINQTR